MLYSSILLSCHGLHNLKCSAGQIVCIYLVTNKSTKGHAKTFSSKGWINKFCSNQTMLETAITKQEPFSIFKLSRFFIMLEFLYKTVSRLVMNSFVQPLIAQNSQLHLHFLTAKCQQSISSELRSFYCFELTFRYSLKGIVAYVGFLSFFKCNSVSVILTFFVIYTEYNKRSCH